MISAYGIAAGGRAEKIAGFKADSLKYACLFLGAVLY
jgi:hypothetical protein